MNTSVFIHLTCQLFFKEAYSLNRRFQRLKWMNTLFRISFGIFAGLIRR